MKKSVLLRQKQGELKSKMSAALEAALAAESGSEARTSQMADYNKHKKEFDELDALIAAAEDQEKREDADAQAEAQRRSRAQDRDTRTPEEKAVAELRLAPIIRQLAAKGNVDGLALELQQEAAKEAREAQIQFTGNFQLPSWVNPNVAQEQRARFESRAQTVTGSGEGATTVPTNVGGLVPILEPRLFLNDVGATFFRGLSGNLSLPRNNSDYSASWEAENAQVSDTTAGFDNLNLTPKRLAAKVKYSSQLLAQSSIDVENFIRERINRAVSRKLEQGTLTGSGSSNQPTGLLNAITAISLGTNGAALTWNNIVALETAVAAGDADMGNLAYLATPGIRGKLKTTEKASSTGQFIWQDTRAQGTRRGELNGYDGFISTLVPSNLTKGTASGVCHALLFGNWADFVVAQWAGIDLLVNPYTEHDMARVIVSVNSWWDMAPLHTASFALYKDVLVS